MNIDILKLDKIVQVRVEDTENMLQFEKIEQFLEKQKEVEVIKKSYSFETPLYEYRYKNILFFLLFDEELQETFLSIPKESDFKMIVELVNKIV